MLPIYRQPRAKLDVDLKDDGSPLTLADLLAHRLIVEGLAILTPHIPCLSEESAFIDYTTRAAWPYYWLIDPIDGTKEFLAQNGDFTVNIALIHNHQAILGVVYAPALQVCYFAASGLGAFKQFNAQPVESIHVSTCRPEQLVRIAASRRHGDNRFTQLHAQFSTIELVTRGSSLKFCLIAEGLIDLYPRFAPTSEWDTAAAQCIVEQAGGQVTDLSGQPLRYNRSDSLLNPYFIAFADATVPWLDYF